MFLFSVKNNRRFLTWVVVGLFSLGLLATYAQFGVRPSDDAPGFMMRGNALLEWLGGHRLTADLPGKMLRFLIPHLVYAAGTRLWGDGVFIAFAIVNVSAYLLVALLIWRLWVRDYSIKYGLAFAFFAAYLFFGLPAETAKYALRVISSDMLAMVFLTAFLYSLFGAVANASSRLWVWSFLFAMLSVVTRPTGIAVPIVLAASIVYLWIRGKCSNRGDLIGLTVVFIVPAMIAFLAWPFLVFSAANDSSWAVAMLDPFPNWVPGMIQNGAVIKGASETWLSPPSSYWEYVLVVLHRFFYYVVPLRAGYSMPHLVTNVVYIPVLVCASILGWRNLRKMDSAHNKAAPIMLLCSFYFALLYSMVLVGHWRYSLSLWPGLWILSGFSFLRLPTGK